MVLGRSRSLVKHVFKNQHKLKSFSRCCSSSLRIQEFEEVVPQNTSNLATEDIKRAASNISPCPYLGFEQKPQEDHEITPDESFKFSDLNVNLAAPYQLQTKPDFSNLLFGKHFTDHMLKIPFFKQLGGWQKPEILPFENLVLHPAAKVLHYAIELFEGMKAYRGIDDKIRMFRPELNMERMNLTAMRTGLPTFNCEEMIKCIGRHISIDQEWVPHNSASSLYVRPTFIGIDPTLGVASSESALLYAILCPVGSYMKANTDGGITLYADPSYIRAWPGGVGDKKMGSNYAPTIDIQSKAVKKGLHQVLWLYGEDRQLTEAGTMNIFMVSVDDNGVKTLSTPPLNGLILPGVTRHSIIQLVKHWGVMDVVERPVTMDEVIKLNKNNQLLELFGCGTACIISPVTLIHYLDTDYKIPTLEQTNPLHKRICETLVAIQYGYIDHPWARII